LSISLQPSRKFRKSLEINCLTTWLKCGILFTVKGGDKMIETFIGSLLGAIIGIMISHTFLHDKGE
jgi:cytosine/uracil/thiamine/allantoin permease